MAADVEKGVDLAPRVPHNQHRVLAHIGAEEVAGFGYLAFMAKEQPAAGKDLLQLLLVYILFDEYPPANQPALSIHQTTNVCDHDAPPGDVSRIPETSIPRTRLRQNMIWRLARGCWHGVAVI